jgi:hypothetical protein
VWRIRLGIFRSVPRETNDDADGGSVLWHDVSSQAPGSRNKHEDPIIRFENANAMSRSTGDPADDTQDLQEFIGQLYQHPDRQAVASEIEGERRARPLTKHSAHSCSLAIHLRGRRHSRLEP